MEKTSWRRWKTNYNFFFEKINHGFLILKLRALWHRLHLDAKMILPLRSFFGFFLCHSKFCLSATKEYVVSNLFLLQPRMRPWRRNCTRFLFGGFYQHWEEVLKLKVYPTLQFQK